MRILAECGATEEGRRKGRFLNVGALRVEEQDFSGGEGEGNSMSCRCWGGRQVLKYTGTRGCKIETEPGTHVRTQRADSMSYSHTI